MKEEKSGIATLGKKVTPPTTESPILNQLLRRASVIEINLDDLEPTFFVIDTSEVVTTLGVDSQAPMDVPVFSFPAEDNLIISENFNPRLWKINPKGVVLDSIGRVGRGPLEFSNSSIPLLTTTGLRVLDPQDGRVVDLDLNFNVIQDIKLDFIPIANRFGASANDNYLITSVFDPEQTLFAIKLFPEIQYIPVLPRIIPAGMQPGGYNFAFATISGSTTATMYTALPYIFVYDENFEVQVILKLKSEHIDTVKNPGLEAKTEASTTSGSNRVSALYFFIKLIGENELWIGHKDGFYIIDGLDTPETVRYKQNVHLKFPKREWFRKRYGHELESVNIKAVEVDSQYVVLNTNFSLFFYRIQKARFD